MGLLWCGLPGLSNFWSTSIGHFEPPQKKARRPHQETEILYANITQWTRDAKEWMTQQVMLVETHPQGQKWKEHTMNSVGIGGSPLSWRPMKQDVVETVGGIFSA